MADGLRVWFGEPQYFLLMSEGWHVDSADELMSSGEIAEYLGWSNSGTAATLWRRGTFPAPVIDKPRARLWRRSDVEGWERSTTRRPGSRNENRSPDDDTLES